MKKSISLLLSVIMILSLFTAVTFGSNAESADAETARTVLCGDADSDGVITIIDATAIQRHLDDMATESFDKDAADADGDKDVTILDATAIQRYLASFASDDNIGQQITVQPDSGEEVTITIFNSKYELHEQMEEMAAEYSAQKGVNVEVYYSDDWIASHLAEKYAAGDPYTISMVDPRDMYALAADHAVDLSDQDWVDKTALAFSADGKVYGFPVCVEARGIIYNADAIKKATGKDFDPASVKTTADFQEVINACIAGGMQDPTGVYWEDWSLGAHFFPEVYEQHADPAAYIAGIKNGSVKLIEDEKFNAMIDTFDVLKNNNYAKNNIFSSNRGLTAQKLAQGEIAFLFGGNWDWPMFSAYDCAGSLGLMPVPNDVDDGSSGKLVGGSSKYFFIDSSEYTSDAQRAAAKDFLNWLVSDPDGQSFLVDDCGLITAFANITLPLGEPLAASVKKYADVGALVPNYIDLPDDHYSRIGASFQKYLFGNIDRAGLAAEITAYWQSAG